MQKEFIHHGEVVRNKVDHVMETVRRAVVSTMGPNGKVSLISLGAVSTKTTKDGVTVARSIKFEDESEELINRVITEPALKTERDCGDGTTTTILLTSELLKIFRTQNSFAKRKQVEVMVKLIIERLAANAITIGVDDPRLYQLALTSSNQDEELARLVTDIYREANVTEKGVLGNLDIILKEGQALNDQIQKDQGRVLRMIYSYPAYGANGQGGELTLKTFTPLVVDDVLHSFDMAVVSKGIHDFMKASGDVWPLVLVARNVEQTANKQFLDIINVLSQMLRQKEATRDLKTSPIIVMQTGTGGAAGSNDLRDLSVMLGAPMLSNIEEIGSVSASRDSAESVLVCGSARSFLSDMKPSGEARIDEQVKEIEGLVGQYSMTDMYSVRGRLTLGRIRRLRGKAVTIHVGGETNSEIKERIDRYDDVVKAVKSALDNGILPGGGTALMRATAEVIDEHPDVEGSLLVGLAEMALAGHVQLFNDLGMLPPDIYTYEYMTSGSIVDLSNDTPGNAEELGVYDTAFAAITALKGGLQTAKLLNSTETLLLGGKLNQVSTQVR